MLGMGGDYLMPAVSGIRCGDVQGEVSTVLLQCKGQAMEMALWSWRRSKRFSNLILNLNKIHLRFFGIEWHEMLAIFIGQFQHIIYK